MAWTKVATRNRPIASWLGLSRREHLNDRGRTAHRQLHDDHRDRQHERCRRHHRHGDSGQNAHRCVWPTVTNAESPRTRPRSTASVASDNGGPANTHMTGMNRDGSTARLVPGPGRAHGAPVPRVPSGQALDRLKTINRLNHSTSTQQWPRRRPPAPAPRLQRGPRCPRWLIDSTARSTCRTVAILIAEVRSGTLNPPSTSLHTPCDRSHRSAAQRQQGSFASSEDPEPGVDHQVRTTPASLLASSILSMLPSVAYVVADEITADRDRHRPGHPT